MTDMNNKLIKYIKNNFKSLIGIVVVLVLLIILIIQTISLNEYKTFYSNETAINKELQVELTTARECINNLEVQSEAQKQQITDCIQQITEQKQLNENKDIQIDNLEIENESLKKTLRDLTAVKDGTFKAENTYDQAIKVWNSLKDLDLNDYVCAGIMGNIMAEVGGQTLDISKWPKYSQGTYYGICQWAGSRKQRLLNDFGTTLEDQIRFLSIELFEEIPRDSEFYSMQDEQDAALYFAKHFERCNSKYYNVRLTNATKALEYFRNNNN